MAKQLRCPACGSPTNLPHLKNCRIMRQQGGAYRDTPTPRMLDYVRDLAKKLGKEVPNDITFDQCSELIDKYKEEVYMSEEDG